MRILVESLHILAGLVAAAAITAGSAWAYPLGKDAIWIVGYVAMAIVLLMGIGPMRRAFAVDRRRLGETSTHE